MGVFTPGARSPQDIGPYVIGYSQLLIQDTREVTLYFWRPHSLSVTGTCHAYWQYACNIVLICIRVTVYTKEKAIIT